MSIDFFGISSNTLWKIMEQTESGIYALPTIQREFVWSDSHIKEFVLAMKKRFPLGMITLWYPSSEFKVDPIPFSDDIQLIPTPFYVLDGQQRITTMLLIKNDFSLNRGGESIERKRIFYNPFNDEVVSRRDERHPEEEILLTHVATKIGSIEIGLMNWKSLIIEKKVIG